MKIIGVAGGSGSGKTTFTSFLRDRLGRQNVVVLAQDSYYKDQSGKFDRDGGKVNFDHPDSLDWDLMESHLLALKAGKSIDCPIYDFATHKRLPECIRMEPKPYVILDGILIFSVPKIWEKCDYKIFIDCEEKIRFERRLKRDVVERGRTPEGVHDQFFQHVKPMHDMFVEVSKCRANVLVPGTSAFDAPIEAAIEEILKLS